MKIIKFLSVAILFAMSAGFAACNDDEGNKEVVLKNGAQTTQTIYADETKGKNEGIEFTTTGPWTAEVAEVATRATDNGIEWLKLNQYSGDKAGDYTLTLTLKQNFTGADRKATIKIMCNSTVTTISVEQKGKKEDGTIPEIKSAKLISKIQYTEEYNKYDEENDYEAIFTYDEQNRVTKMSTGDNEDYYSFTYSDKTIVEKAGEDEITYTIDNNRIASWSTEEPEDANGGYSKQSGTHHYNEDGYLTLVDKTTKVKQNAESEEETYQSQDFGEWNEGNMVKAGDKDDDRCRVSIEYGDVDNTANLDLNSFITRTEWLDLLYFGEPWMIKLTEYMGKRSAKLMTKVTDLYDNEYYTYEYKMNEDGTIGSVSIVGYEADGTVTSRSKYTLTYMDAN